MSVYDYKNYREYLVDFVRSQKISWREMARRCGFKTDSYLIEISYYVKRLSSDSAWAVCHGLGLTGREITYFRLIMVMNDTGNELEREWAIKEMKGARDGRR